MAEALVPSPPSGPSAACCAGGACHLVSPAPPPLAYNWAQFFFSSGNLKNRSNGRKVQPSTVASVSFKIANIQSQWEDYKSIMNIKFDNIY